ncbi:MAG: hypothetical protein COV79_02535 [Parcubacteria group bacterium CG11_big_fil_rev_8_21_14_0_20_41_14]|nr:MAG: hypothetical protein COV79_02535 [Parcubacteria group bacterium CG11_big_fil_rev_8_21_14_0_20_41_14]
MKTKTGIVIMVLLVGIAIPKLTIHNIVSVDERLERCTQYATNEILDNPFQRIALKLGQSRIVETDGGNRVTIEVFTLFRIPLPERIVAFCDQVGIPEQSITVDKTGDSAAMYPFGITEDDIPKGWYMRRSQGIDNAYMVLTKDPNIPWPQSELGEFGEFILVEVHEIGDPEMWIESRVDCDDVALNRSCAWSFLNGRSHLRVEHETPAADAQTDYFLDYGRVAIAMLYPLDSDTETKTAYARFLYNIVAPIVGTAYSRTVLKENCTQDIPRELIDDSTTDYEAGIVTMYWWDGEVQENKNLTVPYEPETDFAGCSESVKEFLRHLPAELK